MFETPGLLSCYLPGCIVKKEKFYLDRQACIMQLVILYENMFNGIISSPEPKAHR